MLPIIFLNHHPQPGLHCAIHYDLVLILSNFYSSRCRRSFVSVTTSLPPCVRQFTPYVVTMTQNMYILLRSILGSLADLLCLGSSFVFVFPKIIQKFVIFILNVLQQSTLQRLGQWKSVRKHEVTKITNRTKATVCKNAFNYNTGKHV